MRTKRVVAALLLCAVIVPGCSQSKRPPLFRGMGPHHRTVATSSRMAQRYFDQGLTWAYAFNHDEAIRSFKEAARRDPGLAIAWWGVALCNGPHINNPVVTPERARAAWKAVEKARRLSINAAPVEQALIEALSARYALPQPEDRHALDQAYADAMAKVHEQYPLDPDVGTLYAEALMDLRPWDLWTQAGEPQPGTETILAVLEDALRLDPENPGANHLYIHAVEASPHPERANEEADRLRDLVPASGHLVHMPSHIDVLTGRWRQAEEQNLKAIEADARYRQRSPEQGFYRVYMLHNHHMLCFAAMMEGREEQALAAARDVVRGVPADYLRDNAAFVDPYMGAVYDVEKRFGDWDAILAEPAPPAKLPITMAMWRFSRGLAYAARGEVAAAEQEQAAFLRAADDVPADALMAINPAHEILRLAGRMLTAEIALGRGEIDACVAELRAAVAIEDSLRYMEPPEWMQPVRHTLGAVLLDAHRFAEAEQVYREDLDAWPNNGWSLYGLSRSLEGQGKNAEAKEYAAQFRKAWSRADAPIRSSCACVPQT
ncbi:MAG: hypothetical protein H6816_07845 [Phycisphaerales bacterium]|nr:hypothetical protein [Phycisphaerales bacterium]